MISSVQNIQTSIKNAPDNVLGMVKGISDNLLNDSNTTTTGKTATSTVNLNRTRSTTLPLKSTTQLDYKNLKNNSSNNLPNVANSNSSLVAQKDFCSDILNLDEMVKY